MNWLIFYPGEKDLEDLAEAAQIDVTVIRSELMHSTPDEKEKISAAKISAHALTQFLKGYPDSPGASAAQIHLAEIQSYLAGMERK
jgi:outer membrane protein assembly factor BamD (BamD/ComL family)